MLQRSPAIREANDFRAAATAALAVKAATGLIGNSSKKETSNKHTKLRFWKDNGKMTEAERILRQYFSDETDITDDLPDRKPKTDALKEIVNAIAVRHDHSNGKIDVPKPILLSKQEQHLRKARLEVSKKRREELEKTNRGKGKLRP